MLIFPSFFLLILDLGSLLDLENDLPDELIPNGNVVLSNIPTNCDGGVAGRMGAILTDAATKHKQLSQLLQSSSAGQPGMSSPSHSSQRQKPGGTSSGLGSNGSPGISINTGFKQTALNSGQGRGLMSQNMAQKGQMLNGMMGPAGQGRVAPGMQYQSQTTQGVAGVNMAGNMLAETLTQEAPQMGVHNAISPQQAGNMNKVNKMLLLLTACFLLAMLFQSTLCKNNYCKWKIVVLWCLNNCS